MVPNTDFRRIGRRELLRRGAATAGIGAGAVVLGDPVGTVRAGDCPSWAEDCWDDFQKSTFLHGDGEIRYARSMGLALADTNSVDGSDGGAWQYTFEISGYHTVTYSPDGQSTFERNPLMGEMAAVGIELSSTRGNIGVIEKNGSGVPKEDAYTYDDAMYDATISMAKFVIGAYRTAGEVLLEGADLANSMGDFTPDTLVNEDDHVKDQWSLNDIADNYNNTRDKTDGEAWARFVLEVSDDHDVADLNARTYMVPQDSTAEFEASVDITIDQSMGGIQ